MRPAMAVTARPAPSAVMGTVTRLGTATGTATAIRPAMAMATRPAMAMAMAMATRPAMATAMATRPVMVTAMATRPVMAMAMATSRASSSIPPTPQPTVRTRASCSRPSSRPFYECYDLGTLPNVPVNWGGLTVANDDANVLLIGGSANTASGKLYSVDITRDVGCHVTGWAGTPIEEFAEAAYNDGGVSYGPEGVLFLARWPNNELGQQLPGSLVTDKVIDLAPFNVVASPGGLNFVPPGFAGEGQLKMVSWSGGQWYSVELAADGNGTFDVVSATYETTIHGGPEGFVHIAADNPGFVVDGLLVSEWSAGNLVAYDADDNGDPIVASRRPFVTGLTGAEGAFLDPYSGDFLFTTFGGGNRLIANPRV